ncbi:MAG: DNA alkylation repair protein, partial [Candidatus Micrarchaeota archaeon]|nr:DNA alkylation repair protein [Candidatus Micrarchaeota archaeon]
AGTIRNGKPTKPNTAMDKKFEVFLPIIVQYATDERNFVKKAVNWALRQIGKRNPALRKKAILTATQILLAHPDSPAAKWVARNALWELAKTGGAMAKKNQPQTPRPTVRPKK